jgi:RNA polymerase sigma factor (sigma-70 family)
MFGGDTSLHRGGNQFPSTRWSKILVSQVDGLGIPEPYLADLAANYWRPVYAYIRTRWSATNEDAKDLTQEFFTWVMESGFVGRADPERGSFRGFLKVALENFLTDADRKKQRHKRGGGVVIQSMHEVAAEDPAWDVSDSGQRTPDAILDDVWRREVLRRVLDGMEDGYRCEGRAVYFDVFRDFYLREDDDVSYADLAARYGIDHNAVSNYLQHAKKRYRDVLRQALADTVESTNALDSEVAWFTGENS